MLNQIAVVVPSLNPDERTLRYVTELSEAGFGHILVVNDGSASSYDAYFERLRAIERCTVLQHTVNRGKGRALKTAFDYFLRQVQEQHWLGLVTADADGQHLCKDTVRVGQDLLANPRHLILGTRNFDQPQVPFKSKFGNKLTTVLFYALYHIKINDTQTGLRGIGADWVPTCLDLPGERYEYEINMLIQAAKESRPIDERLIETVYFKNNQGSHFHPVHDSIKIYRVMFSGFIKFLLSSVSSFLMDIGIFTLSNVVLFSGLDKTANIFASTALARVVSSLANYAINYRLVFQSSSRRATSLLRYSALCAAQLSASAGLVSFACFITKLSAPFVKVFVDLILFFLSFQIQQNWVYKRKRT